MLDLGSTEFHLAIPSYSEPELRRLSTRLFDSWESFAGDALSLPDYSLYLQVEEGSVKGLATVGAVLATVYFGIGNYGDFISGLRTINEQLTATSEYLREHAPTVFSCPESKVTSSRQAGTLASLQRLFVKVQSGALTPDQAMQRAQVLLGEEAESLPGFLEELARAFRDCPRFHEQQKLPFNEEEGDALPSTLGKPKSPKLPVQRPDSGPPLQLRVEVWRESKGKRKQTRVVKL
jgi:hypothetical protein